MSAADVGMAPREVELGDGSLLVLGYDGETIRASLYVIGEEAGRPRIRRHVAATRTVEQAWSVFRMARATQVESADFARYVHATAWGADLP